MFAWLQRRAQWKRDHIETFGAWTNRQEDGLTLFQHQAIAALAGFVPADSFNRVRMDKGEGEYLVASLGADGAELYIYPNEAGIVGAAIAAHG